MSEINKPSTSTQTSVLQYTLLVDAMVAEPIMAANSSAGRYGKKNLVIFWSNLADTLNNAGPPKTIVQWQKVWTTLNSDTCDKACKMRRDRLQSGNTTTTTTLTEIEEKVLDLMGRVRVEGLDVPGGLPSDDKSLLALMGLDADTSVPAPPPPQNLRRPPRVLTRRRWKRPQSEQKLAEVQIATTNMLGEMVNFFVEQRKTDREEMMRDREERMRERERRREEIIRETERDREKRMRERETHREEIMGETERYREEMMRDREEKW